MEGGAPLQSCHRFSKTVTTTAFSSTLSRWCFWPSSYQRQIPTGVIGFHLLLLSLKSHAFNFHLFFYFQEATSWHVIILVTPMWQHSSLNPASPASHAQPQSQKKCVVCTDCPHFLPSSLFTHWFHSSFQSSFCSYFSMDLAHVTVSRTLNPENTFSDLLLLDLSEAFYKAVYSL